MVFCLEKRIRGDIKSSTRSALGGYDYYYYYYYYYTTIHHNNILIRIYLALQIVVTFF